jgi:1-deoxy-D-xylulose-5-phosphate synthase
MEETAAAHMGPLLASVTGPAALKALDAGRLEELAREIRAYLVGAVSRTGGHLGPNLGVVELTIALHRVFDSPRDTVVFDTGHQAYVHKLLTGRQDFSGLRQEGGVSGYPSREESVHDVVENTHASAGLSWAAGIAQGRRLAGQGDRYTVVVVGDGALTGGMSWEALNNIAAERDLRLVIVVNDNGRSYAPTIGGLADHLAGLRTAGVYERTLDWGRRFLLAHGKLGRLVYDALHGLKKGIKDVVAPQILFEDLGLKYIGTVNGHDIGQVTMALERAKAYEGPVIVHAITVKGRGYTPAEAHEGDRFHAVGRIHPETGLPFVASRFGWTSVFADEIVRRARADSRIVALTAAMLEPVGLARFAAEFPHRVFDVGIAEAHAATAAAGMAFAGMHPVVAVYATFLNRAFDQVLMDCALHRAGVTFMLDRAGLTGDDGPSHNGQWDMAMLRMIPGVRVAAPRDGARLREVLGEALEVGDAPTVVRYPKGEVGPDIAAVRRIDGVDVVAEPPGGVARVLIVAMGAFVPLALDAARILTADGVATMVVDPRWVLPTPEALIPLAAATDLVLTLEDGLAAGGAGEALRARLAAEGLTLPVHTLGIPTTFQPTASRSALASDLGLTAQALAARVMATTLVPRPDRCEDGHRDSTAPSGPSRSAV